MTPSRAPFFRRLVPLLPLALYAPTLGRYFVSDDFLILRILSQAPWWQTLWDHLTGPWLGTTVVQLYRPVTSAFFLLETSLLGLSPGAMTVVCLGLHGINAVLVAGLVDRLAPRSPKAVAPCCGLLFALYPLHPNAVAWIAGTGVLISSAFLLASLHLFLKARAGGRRRAGAASVVFFVLALGSYEGAAVWPALLLAFDILLPQASTASTADAAVRRPGLALKLHAAHFGLLGVYLLVRLAIFGSLLGGYSATRQRLARPLESLPDLLSSFPRLLYPSYDSFDLDPLTLIAGGLFALLAVAALLALRSSPDPGGGRDGAVLLGGGLALAVLSQAPFGFPPVVPGNGRYWYLAAAGVALCLGGFATLAAAAARRGRRATLAGIGIAGIGIAGAWAHLLVENLAHYVEAGRLSRVISGEVSRLGREVPPGGTIFVAGYPHFVRNDRGIPMAQVFAWGLRDAVGPPFAERPVRIFPLPALDEAGLAPVTGSPHGTLVAVWEPDRGRLRKLSPGGPGAANGEPPAELLVSGPGPGARLIPGGSGWEVEVGITVGVAPPTKLFVVGPGNAHAVAIPREAVPPSGLGARSQTLPFPQDFARSQAELYDGELFWWLEGRDTNGALRSYSSPRRLWVEKAGGGNSRAVAQIERRAGRSPAMRRRVAATALRSGPTSATPRPAMSKAVP